MKQVPTREQYQAMVRNMPTPELEGLAETFGFASDLTPTEECIKTVIDAEMERRILIWEMQ
jgi:hypothetical protein